MRKWQHPQHSVHHFYIPNLQSNTKILRPRISFRVKTTDIDNQYYSYSIKCEYGSSILEGVEFTVSYAPVDVIHPLYIIIETSSSEGLIVFVLDITYQMPFRLPCHPTLQKEYI